MKQQTLIVVDVESDGPCPGLYSMVSFGAIVVEPELSRTFFGQTAPLLDEGVKFDLDALAVCGVTHDDHRRYQYPGVAMRAFADFLRDVTPQGHRPMFVSDNPAFDWQWINYYFHRFVGDNPFGFSARRIGDFYAGLVGDWTKANDWKRLRGTKHTHDPVDDARGNAEALITLFKMQEYRAKHSAR